jgi:hypothetical protein
MSLGGSEQKRAYSTNGPSGSFSLIVEAGLIHIFQHPDNISCSDFPFFPSVRTRRFVVQAQWNTNQNFVATLLPDITTRVHVVDSYSPQGGVRMQIFRIRKDLLIAYGDAEVKVRSFKKRDERRSLIVCAIVDQ